MQTTQVEQTEDYSTADLYFAAFLIVAGVPIEDLRLAKDGKKVWFHFNDEGQIESLRRGYYHQRVKIEALPFTQEIKNLKNQTHEVMSSRR